MSEAPGDASMVYIDAHFSALEYSHRVCVCAVTIGA